MQAQVELLEPGLMVVVYFVVVDCFAGVVYPVADFCSRGTHQEVEISMLEVQSQQKRRR